MPARPLIGVSTGFTDYGDYLGLAYTRPLTRLGAVPVIVPYLEGREGQNDLLASLDGLLLGVGRDIEPCHFAGQPHAANTDYSSHRDWVELALVRAAIDQGIPMLGVCRGMQVINVALGGSLHADHGTLEPPAHLHPGGDWERWDVVVDATLKGIDAPDHPCHRIHVEPGSLLSVVLGRAAVVNSYHHQSIDRLGTGLVVSARASDGVIEAIEAPRALALCLGVQWELQESWQNHDDQLQIFALLVQAARERCASAIELRPTQDRRQSDQTRAPCTA